MNRRQAISGLVALATSTHGRSAFGQGSTCFPERDSTDLIVDVHCHLLNARDVDRNAFLWRRVLDSMGTPALAAVPIAYIAGGAYTGAATRMQTELNGIDQRLKAWSGDMESACKYIDGWRDQGRPTAGEAANPIMGEDNLRQFRQPRLVNASDLARLYPNVDLFTPSIVDFYEGRYDYYSDVETMAVLFERIALASRMRMLPTIHYNPMRAIHWEANKGKTNSGLGPLATVKRAILDQGFVGIKVHPSVGFAAINNVERACPNEARENLATVPGFRTSKGPSLDRAMAQLFEFCVENDVPVLTHGSPGIPAFAACMRAPANEPLKWLNAPKQWNEAQAKFVADDRRSTKRGLTVCIGHFAGAFSEPGSHFRAWIESLAQVATEMGNEGRLYADLSYQTALTEGTQEQMQTSSKQLQALFKEFPILGKRTLYGSDWHMIAKEANAGAYLTRIEQSLPIEVRRDVLGRNAVEFLGLKKGRGNRDRLDAYIARQVRKSRLPKNFTPRWYSKVDSI